MEDNFPMRANHLAGLLGIAIHVVPDYTEHRVTQNKRHKRKSSRRWQKKWRKRFGTKTWYIDKPIVDDGIVMTFDSPGGQLSSLGDIVGQPIKGPSDTKFYMNRRTFDWLWNHPDMVKYKTNEVKSLFGKHYGDTER